MGQAAGVDRLAVVAFSGVVVLGGVNGIAVKVTVGELAPLWSAGLRFFAAGLLMVAIVGLGRRAVPRGRGFVGALLYGALGLGASYGLLYTAIRFVPAGTVMLLIALVPLFTFGLAVAQRQERFRVQGLLGAVIALAGVGVVTLDQLEAKVPASALVLVVLGTVCIAESGIIAKWIPRSDPFGTNAVAMAAGAALLLGASVLGAEPWLVPERAPTWLALGYLVVLGSVTMFALFLFALGRWTASAVSYATLLMPLVTILVAAILTAERPSPAFLAGGAIVLTGVYVGAFLRLPERRSTPSAPECLPIDACAETVEVAPRAVGGRA